MTCGFLVWTRTARKRHRHKDEPIAALRDNSGLALKRYGDELYRSSLKEFHKQTAKRAAVGKGDSGE